MTEVAVTPGWVCVGCRARVPMADDVCGSCGRAFAEGLASEPPAKPRVHRNWPMILRDFVILNVLFILWRIVGQVSLFHESGAFGRGRWIWHAERVLHLPSEAAMQRAILPHVTLSRICNGYYEYAHAPLLALTLIWLLWRHRDQYPKWRNLVVAFTGLSLVIGLLPVAPPRLIPSLHMVDLADHYHQSVYSALGKGITDQLSSVPSVHIGWAVIVAAAIVMVSRSRWRWLAIAHPVITAYVVVVTANHYWFDGIVAIALLVLIVATLRRYKPRLVP
ncbi:MAG TPA: phosphatase PAP2 family protein [Mycobacteriales bacterium]|nr:phosphatase PAP2 family protein [Mycobacteriales bacterium]